MSPAVSGRGGSSSERFRRTARTALDVLLEADPVAATALGDHRYDDRLPDVSPEGTAATLRDLADAVGALDDLDDAELDAQDAVDLELLRSRLTGRAWALGELGERRWDPLETAPGEAIYSLVARDTGSAPERLRALVTRLGALPAYLDDVRAQLGDMPRVHVETAAQRTRGAVGLLGAPVDDLVARASAQGGSPVASSALDDARTVAAEAMEQHARWLESRLGESGSVGSVDRDPRLGPRDYAARLWYALDTETGPDALLDRAECDLMDVEEQIAQAAAAVAPVLGVSAGPRERVRSVLDALAEAAPVTDADVLDRCRGHLRDLTALVRERDLVTVPDELLDGGSGVQVIEMPEVHRGVAVAYCDPPGALEPDGPDGPPPTFFAVSPTPAGWSASRVASFYREYNDHMLRDLTVHEAMPGHVLQLAHARRHRGSTPVRAALRSGPFVEGWAVYAEQLVAELVADAVTEGSGAAAVVALALRMQQLKMRLRCTINAILDVRVHTRGMTEDEAMRLMTERGHQEVGEAAGKWRRALLSSAQLSTYYVGHAEVSALAADLRAARPAASERELHDALLGHGSPSPRHLRRLLDLP